MKNEEIKFIDLFAGIGGFRLGLENIGKHKSEVGTEWTGLQFGRDQSDTKGTNRTWKKPICVYTNEWDKYASSIYRKHFGECDERDIRTVDPDKLPTFDLICGGFPCQAFSIAGKRRGFEDTRGTLFFEIARIAKAKRPRLLLLENVKGLLSHDTGKTFSTIIRSLDELGYDLQWQVLNSKNFGVPQNRERVFIVGHLRGTPRPKVFPITGRSGKTKNLVYAQKSDREIARIYDTEGIAPTLHLKTGGWQEPKIAHTVRSGGRGSYCKKQNWDGYEVDGRVRRLTPTECERLQGFPDGWTEGISDTQRYKCLGNAVTTNVITEIGKRICLN